MSIDYRIMAREYLAERAELLGRLPGTDAIDIMQSLPELLRRVASEAMAQQRRIDINIVGTMPYSQANGVGPKTVSLIDVVDAIRNQGEA